MLRPLQNIFIPGDYPDLLIGLAEPDDAAVYRLDDRRALVVTTDFFPPVVDDPYDYGAIAAANAMSDVFAMGGEVLFALNIAAFPGKLDKSILSEILRGGAEKVREAGAAIAGGHTTTDDEPKYGLAVIGMADLAAVRGKSGAQPGDVLVLTKPLGAGIVTTALKQSLASADDVAAAVRSMSRLNRNAAQAAIRHSAHAMTDITGFGLLGHSYEMATLSSARLDILFDQLPWLPGAQRHADAWVFPGGMSSNKLFYEAFVQFAEGITDVQQAMIFDPETSGGLLIALPPSQADALIEDLAAQGEEAFQIGRVMAGEAGVTVR